MVLNDTNSTENNSKLPDFNTTIKWPDSNDESINAKESWGTILSNIGEYNFTAICDNEDLNINLMNVIHPVYDLSLRNEPSGQVYVGTWIHSIATAVGGVPLSDDYCMFKITSPSGNIHEIGPVVFGVNDWVDCGWQLAEKGTYLVEVWAYDKNGAHVPASFSFKAARNNNIFMKSVPDNVAEEANASQIITVK
jgi:hypothetical protein